jgi:adenylate kinase family enzyme
LLRKEAPHKPSISALLTQGSLVPDSVILPLIAKELGGGKEGGREEGKEGGYILDGYPRRLSQAKALDGLLEETGLPPVQRVVHIVLADWVSL